MKISNTHNNGRGLVRVNRIIHFRDRSGLSKRWPVVPGYQNVNVTSSTRGLFRQLSPMFLGPVEGSQTMENLWQFSKVLQSEIDNGEPGELFFVFKVVNIRNKPPKFFTIRQNVITVHFIN